MITTQRAPGPKGRFITGNLLAFRRDPIRFLTQCARDYGDITRFKIGPQEIFFANHPDLIKDVLVTHHRNFVKGRGLERTKQLLGEGLLTSEGEFNRRQRRLMQPAFHRKRIVTYGDTMARYAVHTCERWQAGAELDIHQEMMHLTLGVVGKTLFDADVEGEADEIGDALTAAMQLFRTVSLPFAELLDRLPLPRKRRFEEARARLDATIYRMITDRRRSGEDRGDLLSMLLQVQDDESDGGGMTDEQLRDEALTIFLAGHETTANALTWTWYLLSQHPAAEARMHAELDAELDGRLPTAEDWGRLQYTEMVLAESMRLYPPAWVLGRRALVPYPLGPYEAPANSLILMSQYVMHRDARYFPESDRFDPERWTPGARASRPRFSYFPFGGGPRQCIGESFAWMEGVLLLDTIAQRWRLRHCPEHPVELQPLVMLRPRHGMRMVVERRENSALHSR